MIRIFLVILLSLSFTYVGADETRWSKIVTEDGDHIGYTSHATHFKDDVKIQTSFNLIKINEMDVPARTYETTTRFYSNAEGEVIQIEKISGYKKYQNTYEMKRDGNIAYLSRSNKNRTVKKTVELSENTQLDNGTVLIKNWDFEQFPVLAFDTLNLAAMKLEGVTVEKAEIQNNDNTTLNLVRKTYEGDLLRTISTFQIEKSSGHITQFELDLLNSKIRYIPATEEEATNKIRPLSVIRNSMIPAPYVISRWALKDNMRYRFKFRDNIRFDLPQSGEQKSIFAGEFVVLDICDDCGISEELTEEELQTYLQPKPWLESDDPAIVKMANKVAHKDITDAEKMKRLGVFARRRISKVDFMGHYSAGDAMQRRAGDCGEDALLLAALGRAADIPTRVVSGLVYSRAEYHGEQNVFMPHIWTQAYIDGRWVSFDISLGGFDNSHIMTSVGHGDPRSIASSVQLAKRLEWDLMVHVKD